MYSVLICSVFAAYAVIVEKTRRNLESLMAAPEAESDMVGQTLA
jgi:ABC-type Na+ efflux pump permease subunit